jgi:glycyl-tRNA synthetase beta chain
VGTEEIPTEYIENALKNFKILTQSNLKELRINYKDISVYGTPRRLILVISQISERQEDIFHKIKGPAYSIAYDEDSIPQKPALKFAQGQRVEVSKLIIEETKKGKYVFALKSEKGKISYKLLEKLFPKIIKDLNFPKSMRWENKKLRFIRPIRWILALYGEKIIEFDLDGLSSGNITYGHRLLSPQKMEISSTEEYFKKVKKNYVIIDPKVREKIIKKEIKKIIKEIEGEEIINEKQLKEIVYLVEYPHAILGKYDKKYLELPLPVLATVMEKNQKYFPIFKNKDKLLPYFIVVINNSKRYANKIIKGNENVLKARLEDAKFFYREDQKIPLEKKVEKLKGIVFRENLGNLFDKMERINLLSKYIADYLKIKEINKKNLARSALLCKVDLVTEMVKEFPELQGTMGREYAILSNEKKEVAEAIFEHYLPRFSDDILPKSKNGMILGIADKIDNIVGCFSIDLTPTGSRDPYGLRRQALGIISVILANDIQISLKDIIKKSLSLYIEKYSLKLKKEESSIIFEILNFIQDRMKNILLENGIRYDIINAVLAVNVEGNLVDIKRRIEVIDEIYNKTIFKKIVTSSNRVLNLSKNSKEIEIKESLLKEVEEKNLYQHYQAIYSRVIECISNEKYKNVFKILESLCNPIDELFDRVLVMDKDKEIRKNRVALIKKVNILFNQVADLSKIVSTKEREEGDNYGK